MLIVLIAKYRYMPGEYIVEKIGAWYLKYKFEINSALLTIGSHWW